jgi:hypothetical protein
MIRFKPSSSLGQLLAAGMLGLSLCWPAPAALYTSFSGGFANNGAGAGVIPDNNPVGLADARSLSGLGSSIVEVVLTVQLSGSAIEDLRGYLRLGDTLSSPSVSLNPYLTPNNNNFTVPLASFAGYNPNNSWTLFFADVDIGSQNSLTSWSLEVSAVPEPVNVALGLFGAIALGRGGAAWYWKRRAAGRRWAPGPEKALAGRIVRW